MTTARSVGFPDEEPTEQLFAPRVLAGAAAPPAAMKAPLTLVEPEPIDHDAEVRPAHRGGGPPGARRRLSGLDGLRAIAVLAVVFFHLDFDLVPGGFLGVDVFFVISGFLITNLLATEILSAGRLQLGRFYLRRARRLLPTVLALLVVVVVGSGKIWTDQLATLRGGVVSTLFYVTNWWLIADRQSYFVASGRPSMLQHLWSLAIEEQYYLVWTLVVMGVAGLLFGRRMLTDPARRMRRLILVAMGSAIASTMLMAALAIHDDLPYRGSTSRVYFGTDTHSMGLFLGSAAGAWLALRHSTGRAAARPRRGSPLGLGDLLGGLALVVVGYLMFSVDEFRPGLYRGGFLAFDALVLVVIACAVRPGRLFGRVLDMRPMRWIGRRAYAIYIWHWPVVLVTRPGIDVHGPPVLIDAARLTLIVGLAALSYRFVEEPLRRGGYRRWRREQVVRTTWWCREATTALGATTLAAVYLISTAGSPAATAPSAAAVTAAPTTARPTPSLTAAVVAPAPHASVSHAPSATAGRRAGPPAKPALSAFGDSVLVGAETDLATRTSRLHFDAVEGRQAYDVLDDVADRAAEHRLQPDVLIHIGNNGIISAAQLRDTLGELADRRRVVLFTDRVPRDWQDPNNRIIRSMSGKYRNVTVVDWHALSSGHGNWLYSDGLHLTAVGAAAYSGIAIQALRGN